MLEELSKSLKHRLGLPLPGNDAHLKMAHTERRLNLSRYKAPADAKQGSVLILMYEDEGMIRIPLILRPDYDGVHSGQVAFPGGKFEETDEYLETTALREASEEIGVVMQDITIVGKLTELYIPPSNFLVHPFLGTIPYRPFFIPDPNEVSKVIELDIDDLIDSSNLGEKEIKLSTGHSIQAPVFLFKGETVWGATAMMLSELRTLLFEIGF